MGVEIIQICGPGGVVGKFCPFLYNLLAKFFNAQFGNQKFNAGPGAIRFFT